MTEHRVMGELLIKEGLIDKKDLERALSEQREHGGRLGYHLIRLGILNVQRLSQFLRESMGLIPYDLVSWVTDPSIMGLIPANLAQFYQVVPVERNGNTVTVAIADLDNPRIVPALEELTGFTIDPVVCPRETVVQALEHFYGITKDPGVVKQAAGDHLFIVHLPQKKVRAIHWSSLKPDSASVEWLRSILAEAIRSGCRTILVKPSEDSLRIAFRTQSGTEDRFALDGKKRQEMDKLLVELARMKDRKRGSRLEGRIRLQVETRFLNLHVKTLNTLQGNRYTLTIHDEKFLMGDWGTILNQLSQQEGAELEAYLANPSGLLLLAGAPGPGIGAVYYTLLSKLQAPHRQVVALEEYSLVPLQGINQVEASRQEGVSWPELILHALKQAPDLLSIYPIKERKSMEIALLAAAHRPVVGVLHQPGATAVLRWLLDNQFRSPLKAGVLKGILTIASIPTLCNECKLPIEVPTHSGKTLPLMTRQGCEKCLAWDSLPTEEVIEWFPVKFESLPLKDNELPPGFVESSLRERGGITLAQRLIQRAQSGHIDGSEIRDYL